MKREEILIYAWIFGYILNSTLAKVTSSWTQWFNTDTPRHDGIDEETINRVKEIKWDICSGKSVAGAECRVAGSSYVFKNTWETSSNRFYIPCNATGIVCRDRDQRENVFCSDYEIRYLCRDDDGGATYDGGFIAMAAGLSVIVPLICVLIVQLKRAKRDRQRERTAQAASTTTSENTPPSRYNDPPPTYEVLFGENRSLDRYNSTDRLLSPDSSAHGRTSVSSSETSGTSVSTISGDFVQDRSVLSGVDNPALTRITVENETTNQPRRFLGMHLSIHDLFNYTEPQLTTPPPSYNEALEILKKSPKKSITDVQT